MSITYKSDSDLASYYYRERAIEWKPSNQSNKSKIFGTKRLKAVASIVDEDCSIVEFLQSLNGYIRVDIYGKCGTFECDTDCLTCISKLHVLFCKRAENLFKFRDPRIFPNIALRHSTNYTKEIRSRFLCSEKRFHRREQFSKFQKPFRTLELSRIKSTWVWFVFRMEEICLV